jgi:twitching motility protein PilT
MMQVGRAVGMVTLNDALMDLVTKKLITPEEAYLKAVDKPVLATMLKRVGFDPEKPAAAPAPAAAAAAPAGSQRPGSGGGAPRT